MSHDGVSVGNRIVFNRLPYGLNVSSIQATTLMEAISIINVLNQPEFSDTVTSDYEGVDPNQAVEFSQILVNGHKSGRTRIVPMGFRCDADNLEENSDSESSIMPDLVTLSSSESESTSESTLACAFGLTAGFSSTSESSEGT